MKEIFRHIVVSVLTFEAKLLLRRKKPKIIAVTGNVGKTSTKDAIFSIVTAKYNARKSNKSLNSEFGVPLTVLGLSTAWGNPFGWIANLTVGMWRALTTRNYPEWLVLEIGADHPGDIKFLTSWVKPDIAVMTAIPSVAVHVEFFGGIEDLVNEKRYLARALRPGGTLILDADSDYAFESRDVAEAGQTVVSFGESERSDIRITGAAIAYEDSIPVGMKADLMLLENGHLSAIPLMIRDTVGIHKIKPLAAACAVGHALGIETETLIDRLQYVEPPKGRMRLLDGIKETIIIDDTYNSSPIAAHEALRSLKVVKAPHRGRRIAVLGDMLELGAHTKKSHYELGAFAAHHCSQLYVVGIRSRDIAQGALDEGMGEAKVFTCDDVREASDMLQNRIKKGDVVLVKGSQGMRMERIVEEIMADPQHATDLLVRQEDMWKKKAPLR